MTVHPERALALTYAPDPAAAQALAALLSLDDRLAETVRSTREPMLGQIRLKWWEDALAALDHAPPPGEPVLEGLARDVLPLGVSGSALAAVPAAWGELLGADLDEAALLRFADRGRALFEAAARSAGCAADEAVLGAGRGWALADLAQGLSDAGEMAAGRSLAMAALDAALAERWPRKVRALGALALTARLDLDGQPAGSPRRVIRLLWHRFSGR